MVETCADLQGNSRTTGWINHLDTSVMATLLTFRLLRAVVIVGSPYKIQARPVSRVIFVAAIQSVDGRLRSRPAKVTSGSVHGRPDAYLILSSRREAPAPGHRAGGIIIFWLVPVLVAHPTARVKGRERPRLSRGRDVVHLRGTALHGTACASGGGTGAPEQKCQAKESRRGGRWRRRALGKHGIKHKVSRCWLLVHGSANHKPQHLIIPHCLQMLRPQSMRTIVQESWY